MKRLTLVVLILLVVFFANAQENTSKVTLSGELKTGFVTGQRQIGNNVVTKFTYMHNTDTDSIDAFGSAMASAEPARFRFNIGYENGDVGARFRLQTTDFAQGNPTSFKLPFVFAYSYLWDRQIKLNAGKLGDSPWGIGEAPDMTGELDTTTGVRFEFIPNFVPGLNIGFVLNDMNSQHDTYKHPDVELMDYLGESVIGASYDHEYFGVRATFRFDGKVDVQEGSDLIYKAEEKILDNYVSGLKIWISGNFIGLGATDDDLNPVKDKLDAKNWLFVTYTQDLFNVGIKAGIHTHEGANTFKIKPSAYFTPFDKALSVGVAAEIASSDNIVFKDQPYYYWYIEPEIKYTYGNTSVSLSYAYKDHFANNLVYETTRTSKVSLRLTLSF
jgi:hypothetical protein